MPPHPRLGETPFSYPSLSTDDDPPSPVTANATPGVDPLVAGTAKQLAHVINDFKRKLHDRDATSVRVRGTISLTVHSDPAETYDLSILHHDDHGDEYPIVFVAEKTTGRSSATREASACSDAGSAREIASKKRRRLERGDQSSGKRTQIDEEAENRMSPVTKEDLHHLLSKLRAELQEDTSECVNDVQNLLGRFQAEWHEKTKWDDEQLSAHRQVSSGDPIGGSRSENGPSTAFPVPSNADAQNRPLPDQLESHVKLLSSQIHWVEDCRRVAERVHHQRQETWRSTSAQFHDQNRQDRENFQNRILQENTQNRQLLNRILNEVKSIGLLTQSLKWETPAQPYPPPPPPPPPPAQANPSFTPQLAPPSKGRGATE